MPRRIRVLIYDHTKQDALDYQRKKDGVQGIKLLGEMTIQSIELNPNRITLVEVWRLYRLFRRQPHA